MKPPLEPSLPSNPASAAHHSPTIVLNPADWLRFGAVGNIGGGESCCRRCGTRPGRPDPGGTNQQQQQPRGRLPLARAPARDRLSSSILWSDGVEGES